MKLTVLLAALGVTLAVKVTAWPELEYRADEATATVVEARLMIKLPAEAPCRFT